MWTAETDGIRISVTTQYLEDQSDPVDHSFLWSYTVTIDNQSALAVQLLARHWIIMDSRGHRDDVRGPGVVGEQPRIEPGQSFTYTSGCPLATPSGLMRGTFDMERADGTRFLATIPLFSLDSPHEKSAVN